MGRDYGWFVVHHELKLVEEGLLLGRQAELKEGVLVAIVRISEFLVELDELVENHVSLLCLFEVLEAALVDPTTIVRESILFFVVCYFDLLCVHFM